MNDIKILIVEDDFSSRFLLQKLLEPYGTCYVAINGKEAIKAIETALDNRDPYNLMCLDIMMPEVDGHEALNRIRQMEEERGILSSDGIKIIMTTALCDMKNVMNAFHNLCDGYLTKPISKSKLLDHLHTLGFISSSAHTR